MRKTFSWRLFAVLALSSCSSGGGEPIYAACQELAECDADAQFCQRVEVDWPEGLSVGNVCTVGCIFDDDCPPGPSGERGRCISFGRARFLCYEACTLGGDDCAGATTCGDVGDEVTVCLPRG